MVAAWGVGSCTTSMCTATPLMMAAYGGSDAAARYVIAEYGIGVDSLFVLWFTALLVVAMCGHGCGADAGGLCGARPPQ